MKKYISLVVLIAGLSVMNSCLDQDPLFDPKNSNNILEFFDLQAPSSSTQAPHHLFVNSYDISTTEEHRVQISYSGAHDNKSAITVQLAISETALDEYNQFLVDEAVGAGDTLADGTPDFAHILQYELLPESFYSVPGLTVTIPAGQTKADLIFTVNTTVFDFAKAYVLPLRIVSASSGIISGNYGVSLFNIGAKNAYHGSYQSVGTRWNFNSAGDWDGLCCPPGGFTSASPWNFITDVLTVDEFTSTVHAANSNGGFGTFNITVNPDNTVTIQATANTGLNALVPMQPSAGKVSRYDPVAKTFELYYQYTNTGGTFRTMEHFLEAQ